MDKEEKLYRKWIGICQMSSVTPLVMRIDGRKIYISVKDDVLLKISKRRFMRMSANKIVKKMGVPKK